MRSGGGMSVIVSIPVGSDFIQRFLELRDFLGVVGIVLDQTKHQRFANDGYGPRRIGDVRGSASSPPKPAL